MASRRLKPGGRRTDATRRCWPTFTCREWMAANSHARSGTRKPIVAVTANAMKGEDERCLAAGMDAYLAKPVNMDQLRTTLERWMPIEDVTREAAYTDDAPKPPSAIDREVLAAWLGDDSAA